MRYLLDKFWLSNRHLRLTSLILIAAYLFIQIALYFHNEYKEEYFYFLFFTQYQFSLILNIFTSVVLFIILIMIYYFPRVPLLFNLVVTGPLVLLLSFVISLQVSSDSEVSYSLYFKQRHFIAIVNFYNEKQAGTESLTFYEKSKNNFFFYKKLNTIADISEDNNLRWSLASGSYQLIRSTDKVFQVTLDNGHSFPIQSK